VVKRQGILLPNPADPSQAIGTPRVARFGWKDALTNLAEFSAAAYVGELGITTQSCVNGAPFLIFASEPAPNGIPVAPGCDDLAPPPPPGVPAGVDEAVGSCDGGRTELQDDVQSFLTFMTFPWVLVTYLVVNWLAKDKPGEFYDSSREDTKFWQAVRARPGASVRDVRARFRDIDRRIADIETHVTSQNSALAREIDALR